MVHSKAANGSTFGLGITEAFTHSGANVVLNGFGGGLQIERTRSELAHARLRPTRCSRQPACRSSTRLSLSTAIS